MLKILCYTKRPTKMVYIIKTLMLITYIKIFNAVKMKKVLSFSQEKNHNSLSARQLARLAHQERKDLW